MKIDKTQITFAVKTGEVILGAQQVCKSLMRGNPKLVILAANCPTQLREKISYYGMLAEVPVHISEHDGIDLGSLAAKPFSIAVMAVMNQGDSDILNN